MSTLNPEQRRRPRLRGFGGPLALGVAFVGAAWWLLGAAEAPAPTDDASSVLGLIPGLEQVGAGSYFGVPPANATRPPPPVRVSSNLPPPLPTHRFWSSLVAGEKTMPMYPHPLAVHPTERGLRVAAPQLAVQALGYSAVLDEVGDGEDLCLSSTALDSVSDVRLESYGDWSVDFRLSSDDESFTVSVAHGSPYVFARFEAGAARVRFSDRITVWGGDLKHATLGITVRGRHYGLFGPGASTWTAVGARELRNLTQGDAKHFSLALLPAANAEVLALFARHAGARITDTRVSYGYQPQDALVTTRFELSVDGGEDPLIALYPHQWAHTTLPLLPHVYPTVRGEMRLARTRDFTTALRFSGLLPNVPPIATLQEGSVAAWLDDEKAHAEAAPLNAYLEGKLLGRLATQLPLLTAMQRPPFVHALEVRLERRLSAVDSEGRIKPDRIDYDARWGALIMRPSAFGNDTDLNDQHLQLGYYLRAAAALAEYAPGFMDKTRYGGMVELLVRNLASLNRKDPLFPFLRSFDPYAGHSWASGFAPFSAGNNLESSSEAMNAWSAMLLLAESTADTGLRDLAAALYATELSAIEAYWFDVEQKHFPPGLKTPALAMIWGGKGWLETWFTREPEALFGINWLPLHGGSLYLGRYPDAAARTYGAVHQARGSDQWQRWNDLVIMYRSLSDPGDALRQLERLSPRFIVEEGNSRLSLEHWVRSLAVLGQVDRSVYASTPLAVTFRRGESRHYVVYCMPTQGGLLVRFSNGKSVRCTNPGFIVEP